MLYLTITATFLFLACVIMAMIILDYKTIIDTKDLDIQTMHENIKKLNRNREYWIKRFRIANDKLKVKK